MPKQHITGVTWTGAANGGLPAFERIVTVANVQYEQAGPTFTDRTAEARLEGGTAFALLAVTTDRLYIGSDDTFERVRFDLAVAGAGVTLVVEYWNGSSWVAVSGLVDGTSNLSVDGNLSFTRPTRVQWQKNSINGGTSYYHLRLTTTSAPSTAPTAHVATINWSIYDGAAATNAKVFFSPGEDGTRSFYLLVNDNTPVIGASAASAKVMGVRSYESWDAVGHTGTNPSPTVAQVAGQGLQIRKSTTADGTARSIAAFVSRDVIFIGSATGDTASRWHFVYLGLTDSYVTADAWAFAVIGHNAEAADRAILNIGSATAITLLATAYIQRQYLGTLGSGAVQLGQCPGMGYAADTAHTVYPNLANNKMIYENSVWWESGPHIRCQLKNVLWVPHVGSAAINTDGGDTVTINGTVYKLYRHWSTAVSVVAPWVAVEYPN